MKQLALFIVFITVSVFAAEGGSGKPPAPVVTAPVLSEKVTQQNTFVGTIHFHDTSNVATEVGGIVEKVRFQEGDRVKKGQELVTLNDDLLKKQYQAAKANHLQSKTNLALAQKDLNRIQSLYDQGSVAEKTYDENRFNVLAMESQTESYKAEMERLEIELAKKHIKAPFSGVVLEKSTHPGEWLSPGSTVALIAQDDVVDAKVDIPEELLQYLSLGANITVISAKKEIQGKVSAIIPKGDVTTRTFPVKVSLRNTHKLKEGMEATVRLPIAAAKAGIVVPRDAIIPFMGKDMVYVVLEGKATPMPVQVLEYKGDKAGVASPNLQPGMPVIIKGQERLAPMQAVMIINADKK